MKLLTANELTITIGTRRICENFNLTLQAGEVWGILGPNGVGKTTLLHTLAGIHRAKSGNVLLKDKLLTSLPKKTIARQIGLLFQSINSNFPQTILEYVQASRFPHHAYFEKPSPADRDIIEAALRYTSLDTYQDRNIQTLSGGEKRRLAIAAILAQTPQIYLLDEPTNHLDMYYQLRMLTHFQQLTQEHHSTAIMSLHDVNLAQKFCSHILLMHHDGSMQLGEVCDILTEDNLSRLYEVNVRRVSYIDGVVWHALSSARHNTNKEIMQ